MNSNCKIIQSQTVCSFSCQCSTKKEVVWQKKTITENRNSVLSLWVAYTHYTQPPAPSKRECRSPVAWSAVVHCMHVLTSSTAIALAYIHPPRTRAHVAARVGGSGRGPLAASVYTHIKRNAKTGLPPPPTAQCECTRS